MDRASPQLPDCTQIREQIESGFLSAYSTAFPKRNSSQWMFREAAEALDTCFRLPCVALFKLDDCFKDQPPQYISKIHETVYKTFFLLSFPVLKNSTDELYDVAFPNYSLKKIAKAVSKQLDELILKIRTWPYFEKETLTVG